MTERLEAEEPDGTQKVMISTDGDALIEDFAAVRGSSQSLARLWSVAFYMHPVTIDGMMYPSLLNEDVNLAIYDRAISKLNATSAAPLLKATRIGNLIRDFKVAII